MLLFPVWYFCLFVFRRPFATAEQAHQRIAYALRSEHPHKIARFARRPGDQAPRTVGAGTVEPVHVCFEIADALIDPSDLLPDIFAVRIPRVYGFCVIN